MCVIIVILQAVKIINSYIFFLLCTPPHGSSLEWNYWSTYKLHLNIFAIFQWSFTFASIHVFFLWNALLKDGLCMKFACYNSFYSSFQLLFHSFWFINTAKLSPWCFFWKIQQVVCMSCVKVCYWWIQN
jgi:hypothetical protein